MTQLILKNARIFDGVNEDCPEGMHVLVANGLIQEVSSTPLRSDSAQVIDVGGRTLMPGLIDAHMHAYTSDVNPQRVDTAGEAYRTAHAVRVLHHALNCGFTTVRDIGGGDYSLANAIDAKLLQSPRFFYAGKILSMTGGHGDFRNRNESRHTSGYCTCGEANSLCVIADGVDACIKATREELRRGAHCIKIMGSGGVASPTDPIWMNQYREDEIRAIVNETQERRSYTAAHCHPASAIRRCVEFGVRSIEHGTLIDEETARFVAERGAFVVPTMVVIFVLSELGRQMGMTQETLAKVDEVIHQALTGLDIMRKAGVKIGFGTDLLGDTYVQQCREFTLRREVFTPVEILRQATSISAELMMHQDKLGCVKPGAFADLLVVDGDPLKDIGLLAANGQHLKLIMRAGELVKNELA
jgi:imidazolonepropionase-like amidohydrolase